MNDLVHLELNLKTEIESEADSMKAQKADRERRKERLNRKGKNLDKVAARLSLLSLLMQFISVLSSTYEKLNRAYIETVIEIHTTKEARAKAWALKIFATRTLAEIQRLARARGVAHLGKYESKGGRKLRKKELVFLLYHWHYANDDWDYGDPEGKSPFVRIRAKADLIKVAKARGINGYSRLRAAELLEAIRKDFLAEMPPWSHLDVIRQAFSSNKTITTVWGPLTDTDGAKTGEWGIIIAPPPPPPPPPPPSPLGPGGFASWITDTSENRVVRVKQGRFGHISDKVESVIFNAITQALYEGEAARLTVPELRRYAKEHLGLHLGNKRLKLEIVSTILDETVRVGEATSSGGFLHNMIHQHPGDFPRRSDEVPDGWEWKIYTQRELYRANGLGSFFDLRARAIFNQAHERLRYIQARRRFSSAFRRAKSHEQTLTAHMAKVLKEGGCHIRTRQASLQKRLEEPPSQQRGRSILAQIKWPRRRKGKCRLCTELLQRQLPLEKKQRNALKRNLRVRKPKMWRRKNNDANPRDANEGEHAFPTGDPTTWDESEAAYLKSTVSPTKTLTVGQDPIDEEVLYRATGTDSHEVGDTVEGAVIEAGLVAQQLEAHLRAIIKKAEDAKAEAEAEAT